MPLPLGIACCTSHSRRAPPHAQALRLLHNSSAEANGRRALASGVTKGGKPTSGVAGSLAADGGDIALRSGDSARRLRGESARGGVGTAVLGAVTMGAAAGSESEEAQREAWLRKELEVSIGGSGRGREGGRERRRDPPWDSSMVRWERRRNLTHVGGERTQC